MEKTVYDRHWQENFFPHPRIAVMTSAFRPLSTNATCVVQKSTVLFDAAIPANGYQRLLR
uniref:Uncharacterized protein n=1 Tax=Candidatus Kentrum sp. TC TaxID=2126339 RepID=A0A450Z692_9GAMM|nr:MAG: hypothetical protein BECKTC1821D_GA0114238_10721 [Candidatus Kentron sp. TC]